MARLDFDKLEVEPWLGVNQGEVRQRLASDVTDPRFKERWKYTSPKKVFDLQIGSEDSLPSLKGTVQAGVNLSEKPSQQIQNLVSPKLINEKILLISQAKTPLSIEIKQSLEEPLEITHLENCSAIFLFVGQGVSCLINEYFKGETAQRHAMWVVVDQGAKVIHSRQSLNNNVRAWKYLSVTQNANSDYESHCHNTGGELKRDDFDIDLKGNGSSFTFKSASFIGPGQHLDQQISLKHRGQSTTSLQQINNVGDTKSSATCNGRILIEKEASKASAALSNQNLSLGKNVTFNAKPELEIYNDDVTCSHGATIGQLSDSELFYLTSRGIDPENAKTMMARGFLNKALDGPLAQESNQHFDQLFTGA